MRRLIALASLVTGCISLGDPGAVDRRVHGETATGRFVDETAYEVMLTAALDEAAGRYEQAEGRYLLLTRLDGGSADAWSRLGLARCRRGVGRAHVDAAFDEAARVEPEFAPAWERRARCQLSRGEVDAASRSAARAFAAEPTSLDVSSLLIELARRRGDEAEATRLTRGLRVMAPGAVRGGPRAPDGLREVDVALLRGRYDEARAASRAAGLTPPGLALRAAALGRLSFARELAALSPGSADARVAAYAADGAAELVASVDGASPLALALLRDTLSRRGLAEAALLVPRVVSDDPLVRALEGAR